MSSRGVFQMLEIDGGSPAASVSLCVYARLKRVAKPP